MRKLVTSTWVWYIYRVVSWSFLFVMLMSKQAGTYDGGSYEYGTYIKSWSFISVMLIYPNKVNMLSLKCCKQSILSHLYCLQVIQWHVTFFFCSPPASDRSCKISGLSNQSSHSPSIASLSQLSPFFCQSIFHPLRSFPKFQ